MRGLLLVLLVGCTISPGDSGTFDPGAGQECRSDSACSNGDVCTRTSVCLPPSQVRAVHAMWTLSGEPASELSCSDAPDLKIKLHASTTDARLEFVPVPCVAGKFSVDKLPRSFDRVELGPADSSNGWRSASFDAVTGEAFLDLPL